MSLSVLCVVLLSSLSDAAVGQADKSIEEVEVPLNAASAAARKYVAEAAIRQEARRKKRAQLAPLVNRAAVNFTYDDYWRGQRNLGLATQREFFPELSTHKDVLPWLERGLDSALSAAASAAAAAANSAGAAPHTPRLESSRATLRVLHIGAGMSTLTDEMLARGYADLTNTDVSAAAVDMLRRRTGPRGGRYEVADATNLKNFANGSFDAIVEKGALDYLVSETDGSLPRALAELARVLSPVGIFCSISGAGGATDDAKAPRLLPFIKGAFPSVEVLTVAPQAGDPRPAHLFLGRFAIDV